MTKSDLITTLETTCALCAIKARNAKDLDEAIETWKVAVRVAEMVIEATEGLQIAQDLLRPKLSDKISFEEAFEEMAALGPEATEIHEFDGTLSDGLGDYLREAKERLENAQEEKQVETEVSPEVWDRIFPKL